ncbi:hypothetical protein CYMTET_24752 [Cymbomonas tetramitiformis]|uniref:Sialyltransferase-like protein n=1 Tax=Cymbomonas tetramitiformis TaxID=36881 RepID=A0AAE0FW09_9CHLO|nr:hypothetical protein CYMTET_24752 [Cymbomonas tetramitiformis]
MPNLLVKYSKNSRSAEAVVKPIAPMASTSSRASPRTTGTRSSASPGVPQKPASATRTAGGTSNRTTARSSTKKPPRPLTPTTPVEELPPLEGNPRELPEPMKLEDLFVYKTNAKPQGFKDLRLAHLPPNKAAILKRFKSLSCAVVGSSGNVLEAAPGAAIMKNDVVLRINAAPSIDFGNHVGNRTDMRLLSRSFTHRYSLPGGSGVTDVSSLPLEWGSTLLVHGAREDEYNALVDALGEKWLRRDVSLLLLSPKFSSLVKKVVGDYRRRLMEDGFVLATRGATPSSGFMAVYLTMLACQSLTAYGFGLTNAAGKGVRFHYWDREEGKGGARFKPKSSNTPLDVEYSLLRTLAAKRYLRLCAGEAECAGNALDDRRGIGQAFSVVGGGNSRWGDAFEDPEESAVPDDNASAAGEEEEFDEEKEVQEERNVEGGDDALSKEKTEDEQATEDELEDLEAQKTDEGEGKEENVDEGWASSLEEEESADAEEEDAEP